MTKADTCKKIKVIVIGNHAVGKTTMINKLTKEDYTPHSTIGAVFSKYSIDMGDEKIELHVWDTAGSEKFIKIAEQQYKNADAAIVVYSVNDRDSFAAVPTWLDLLKNSNKKENVVVALVGNKIDLERKVSPAEVENLKNIYKNISIYKEMSAMGGELVSETFHLVARSCLDSANRSVADEEQSIHLSTGRSDKSSKKHSCC